MTEPNDHNQVSTIDVLRCPACNRLDSGVREVCTNCHRFGLIKHTVPGKGTLLSWTVIRKPPARFTGEEPYTVVLVQLDEGPHITGRLAQTPLNLSVGDAVTSIPSDSDVYNTFERTSK